MLLRWKRVCAVACAVLLLAALAPVQAAGGLTLDCMVQDETVTILGTVSQPGTRPVSIVVVNPGASLADMTPQTAAGLVNQSLAVTTDADGNFSVRYTVGGGKGRYTVYAVTPEGERQTKTFDYCDPNEIVNAVNAASSTAIGQVLKEYAPYIGIDMQSGSLYGGLSSAQQVLAVMEQTVFQSPSQMKEIFRQQVLLAALPEATNATIDAVMAEVAAVTQSSMKEAYEALTDARKQSVAKTMLAERNYGDMGAVDAQFEEGVVLALIGQAGYPGNEALLKQYAEKTGAAMDGDYKKLSKTKQAAVLKAIAQKEFTTYAALKSYFNEQVTTQLNTGTNSRPGGGGGSSGSGGGKTNVIPLEVNTFHPQQPGAAEQAGGFTDLEEAQWARESITALCARGIVSGVGDGRFEPNRQVTREEFVKMLVETVGAVDSAPVTFSDVQSDAWYARYVGIAMANGMITGYPDGRFGVGEPVSRQDIAVMIQRAARMFDYPLTAVNDKIDFIDDNAIMDYAKDAVYAMQRADLMNGVDGARFDPASGATRAMVAKVLYGLLQSK